MTLQPFSGEQLNFFKFSLLILDEFPRALRQAFKTMWDNTYGSLPGFQLWDDSTAVRNLFATTEGGKTKVPIHQSYNEWDCTNLFQATIFAQSFASSASTGSYTTLSDFYVKPRAVPHGSFHACVLSRGGNNEETFALAIDQLRRLRNSLCHSTSSKMDKLTFDQRVSYTKDAFKALGVPTATIDLVGSLTESDFPTNEVRRLDVGIREETRAYIKFLEDVSSDISDIKESLGFLKSAQRGDTENITILENKIKEMKEAQEKLDAENKQKYTAILEGVTSTINTLKNKVEENTASREDISRFEKRISELKEGQDERYAQPKTSGMRSSLLAASLPSMVPNFTGRQGECEKIISHVTSESIRLVSIWGSPGFGKTSVAIAVGHALQSQGLPVFWVSLRGLRSKADLVSKFLSFLRPPKSKKKPSGRCLPIDDDLFQLFSELSKPSVFILDNADDLLESSCLRVKEEVIRVLEEILRQDQRVTFVVTTRESLEFMDVHFQGHQGLRIRPLDEASAQTLVSELLPNVITHECTQVAQICGYVPLAMKLMCSLISEKDDISHPRHFLDDFMTSSTESVVKVLDNPGYPSSHRLQVLFESSFQLLNAQEQEALICLSILPENFSTEVAAAVLVNTETLGATKILRSLQRRSLIDSSSKPGSFTMHKLLQSFSRDKGEKEMTEAMLNSKSRLNAFYLSLFEKLNEQFLTGHSMTAYIAFYENKKSIIQSLTESCSDTKTAENAFDVLAKGELFLDSLFWIEGNNFDYIYEAAIQSATLQGNDKFLGRLLTSRAFSQVTWGQTGYSKQLLSKVKKIQASSSFVSDHEKGKYLCYLGIYHLAAAETHIGVQCLKDALSSLNSCKNPEQIILKLVIFQILVVYYQSLNDSSSANKFYNKAHHQCSSMGHWQLLIIPKTTSQTKETTNEVPSRILPNQPLKCEIACLLSEATKIFADSNTKQCLNNSLLQIVEDVEKEIQISLGLLIFHRVVTNALWVSGREDPVKLYAARINYHQAALKQGRESSSENYNVECLTSMQNEALAKCFLDLGTAFIRNMNYPEALQANQRALDITKRFLGEEHESTADSYRQLGVSQYNMHDYNSALQSHKRALAIRIKVFGDKHESTADCYVELGAIQHSMKDFESAFQSQQRALDIRIKKLGKEHERTAESYRQLGVTQNDLHDYKSAFQSFQNALAIRISLFGVEHEKTAQSYRELGLVQHNMHDYKAALQSHHCALTICIKLFGEDHESTANSFRQLGVTQNNLHDYKSALQSFKNALAIRIKLFGAEHEQTAESYMELGLVQHNMCDYKAALQSHRCALTIRIKLFGDDHESTADSYRQLGITQNDLHDYNSAFQSFKCALTIRVKLFGEDHESTADGYRQLGVAQYNMDDYRSALQSQQRALAIHIKSFGEDHKVTANSYKELGITQYSLCDYKSALQSQQRALAICIKLFGEDHKSTADSYRELSTTQYRLGDYKAALQSQQRALAIRIKLFGKRKR